MIIEFCTLPKLSIAIKLGRNISWYTRISSHISWNTVEKKGLSMVLTFLTVLFTQFAIFKTFMEKNSLWSWKQLGKSLKKFLSSN